MISLNWNKKFKAFLYLDVTTLTDTTEEASWYSVKMPMFCVVLEKGTQVSQDRCPQKRKMIGLGKPIMGKYLFNHCLQVGRSRVI